MDANRRAARPTEGRKTAMTRGDRWVYVQAWGLGIAMLASAAIAIAGWF